MRAEVQAGSQQSDSVKVEVSECRRCLRNHQGAAVDWGVLANIWYVTNMLFFAHRNSSVLTYSSGHLDLCMQVNRQTPHPKKKRVWEEEPKERRLHTSQTASPLLYGLTASRQCYEVGELGATPVRRRSTSTIMNQSPQSSTHK